ncbi:MAG TPA: hypothetical protein VEG27_05580 [Usitatibacter sp.]|nr:hypothetical protein [Usitatibacter sp.]
MIALLAPVLFSLREGHFRSSLKGMAVDSRGNPLPWYTYPAIDFLRRRSFAGKRILEFGAGQSTLWWAARAASVVSIEKSEEWLERVQSRAPSNVELHLARSDSPESCLADARRAIAGRMFDVIVIDGLFRHELIPLSIEHLAPRGAIVCDNSDGYGFHEGFLPSGMLHVDFFGLAPAGIHSFYCTSVFFRPDSFVVDAEVPILADVREAESAVTSAV